MQAGKFKGSFSSLEKALVLDLKKRTILRNIWALLSEKNVRNYVTRIGKKNKEMNYKSHFGLCPFENGRRKNRKNNSLKAPGTEVRTEILSVSFKL